MPSFSELVRATAQPSAIERLDGGRGDAVGEPHRVDAAAPRSRRRARAWRRRGRRARGRRRSRPAPSSVRGRLIGPLCGSPVPPARRTRRRGPSSPRATPRRARRSRRAAPSVSMPSSGRRASSGVPAQRAIQSLEVAGVISGWNCTPEVRRRRGTPGRSGASVASTSGAGRRGERVEVELHPRARRRTIVRGVGGDLLPAVLATPGGGARPARRARARAAGRRSRCRAPGCRRRSAAREAARSRRRASGTASSQAPCAEPRTATASTVAGIGHRGAGDDGHDGRRRGPPPRWSGSRPARARCRGPSRGRSRAGSGNPWPVQRRSWPSQRPGRVDPCR